MGLKKYKIVIAWLAFCIGFTELKLSAVKERKFFVAPDSLLDEAFQQRLFAIINHALSTHKSINDLLPLIIKELPSTHTITLKNKNFVRVEHAQPWLKILCQNQEPSVLCRSGNYVPYSRYQEDKVSGLPTIIVEEPSFREHDATEGRSYLFSWVKCLPERFFERFSAVWKNQHSIFITDKLYPQFILLTSIEAPFNLQINSEDEENRENNLLKKLSAHVKKAGLNPKSSEAQQWLVDLRFKGQVVLSRLCL